MRRFEYDKETCDGWRSYPVRITLDRVSSCCSTWLVLVQSMKGGFVTADCFKCGRKHTVKGYEFQKLPLIVCCPECKGVMAARMVDKNYSYVCEPCDLFIDLADILPKWTDIGVAPETGQTGA
jgi:hypothetical protein